MKQAETLSLKDSRIAELEELARLKRKGLLRMTPGIASHHREPSFAESMSGAEEELLSTP